MQPCPLWNQTDIVELGSCLIYVKCFLGDPSIPFYSLEGSQIFLSISEFHMQMLLVSFRTRFFSRNSSLEKYMPRERGGALVFCTPDKSNFSSGLAKTSSLYPRPYPIFCLQERKVGPPATFHKPWQPHWEETSCAVFLRRLCIWYHGFPFRLFSTLILTPFPIRGNWGADWLSRMLKVTQLIKWQSQEHSYMSLFVDICFYFSWVNA